MLEPSAEICFCQKVIPSCLVISEPAEKSFDDDCFMGRTVDVMGTKDLPRTADTDPINDFIISHTHTEHTLTEFAFLQYASARTNPIGCQSTLVRGLHDKSHNRGR